MKSDRVPDALKASDDLIPDEEKTAWQTFIFYLKALFDLSKTENEVPLVYPKRANRYYAWGWNQHFQSCYTDADLELLERIKERYMLLPDVKPDHHHFDVSQQSRLYDWWICKKPERSLLSKFDINSFTLPNRESKDSNMYPLWNYADNMARQIANWQGDRVKNQNIDLMNDPVMLVFNELKDWFFNVLTEKECKKESLEHVIKRQSYIKNIIHLIPHFGPDRLYLHDIQNRLDQGANIILNCIANKQLPDLLSDIIIKGKSLETTIGTYLHFLLTNEEVADNFSYEFIEGGENNCNLSPVCKIYKQALSDKTSVNPDFGLIKQDDLSLIKYQEINKFYKMEKIAEENGKLQIKIRLKENLLNKVKFANFLTNQDKQNYLEAIAALDSLISIRKTLENFKSVQSSLGTYVFASSYLDKTNSLSENYIELINKTQQLIEQLLHSANNGLKLILRNPNHEKNSNKYFERNLRALDTRFAHETTTSNQLDLYCMKAKESMNHYQEAMTKLVIHLNSGEASRELKAAMQHLLLQINHMNNFIPAQLDKKQFTIDHRLELEMIEDACDASSAKPVKRLLEDTFLDKTGGEHVSNDRTLVNSQITFDFGKWDDAIDIIKVDPLTKEPIFTYRVYVDKVEVGSAEFYGQPLLCFSKDRKRHNMINRTGILKQLNMTDDMSIADICNVLPPTLFDKVLISATNGAFHGFLRGGSTIIGATLQSFGAPKRLAESLKELSYYGCLFAMNFHQYCGQMQEEDETSHYLNAFYHAAVATGEICLINYAIQGISTFIEKASETLKQRNWFRFGEGLKRFGSMMRFGMFAYHAVEHGVPEISASVLAGSVAQTITEQTGSYVISKRLG